MEPKPQIMTKSIMLYPTQSRKHKKPQVSPMFYLKYTGLNISRISIVALGQRKKVLKRNILLLMMLSARKYVFSLT